MSTQVRKGRGPHFAQVPHELLDNPESTAFHVASYAALRSFADFSTGENSHASEERIAARAGCSSRQFRRCRKDLREWGWIEWQSRKDEGATTVYVVHASLEGGSDSQSEGSDSQADGGSDSQSDNLETSTTPKASNERPPEVPQGGTLELIPQSGNGNGEDPAQWMHEIWHEELGSGRRISLTDSRRKKYRAMYAEQLADAPDPRLAWRVVLRAVKRSDHHMSERSYQMPESLLRNADRRDTWVERTASMIEAARKKSQGATDFAAYYRSRR